MKTAAIVLALIAAGLAAALYKANTASEQSTTAAETRQTTLSNQVAELRTKLALEQGSAAQSTSNLQHLLIGRTANLLAQANFRRS